jgi:hypothetical protein
MIPLRNAASIRICIKRVGWATFMTFAFRRSSKGRGIVIAPLLFCDGTWASAVEIPPDMYVWKGTEAWLIMIIYNVMVDLAGLEIQKVNRPA